MSALPPDDADGPFDGEDLTAAEYALGVLDMDERRSGGRGPFGPGSRFRRGA